LHQLLLQVPSPEGFSQFQEDQKVRFLCRAEKFPQIYYTQQKKITKLIWLESECIQETGTITRNRFPWEKSSGLLIGRITSSWSAFLTSSRAPMSSNFTPISPGATTAETKLLSNSSFARFCNHILYDQKQHKIKKAELMIT